MAHCHVDNRCLNWWQVISLFVWPYGIIKGKAAYFVLYYMTTELTNIGQNLYLVLREFKSSFEMPIAVLWMLSFFVVRVLPVPWLLYVLIRIVSQGADSCSITVFDLSLSLVTVPIPIGLNLFWFSKMVAKAQRMVNKTKKAK